MIRYILIAGCIGVIAQFLPKKSSLLSRCELLVEKIKGTSSAATRVENVCELPEGGIWRASYGVIGTIQRMRIAYLYLKLVQAFHRKQLTSEDDLLSIWRAMGKLLLFGILALLGSHKRAAKKAIEFYCLVIIQTIVLCDSANAPECLMILPDLL